MLLSLTAIFGAGQSARCVSQDVRQAAGSAANAVERAEAGRRGLGNGLAHYNGSSGFGDISIIVGSVDNTPGEFVLVIEGLVVTDADNIGDAPGDPITLHLTPNMHASTIPVSAYMISVTQGLDPFIRYVSQM